jgi:hypothetical protein
MQDCICVASIALLHFKLSTFVNLQNNYKNIALMLQNIHKKININIHLTFYIYLHKSKAHNNKAFGLHNMHQILNISLHLTSYTLKKQNQQKYGYWALEYASQIEH